MVVPGVVSGAVVTVPPVPDKAPDDHPPPLAEQELALAVQLSWTVWPIAADAGLAVKEPIVGCGTAVKVTVAVFELPSELVQVSV